MDKVTTENRHLSVADRTALVAIIIPAYNSVTLIGGAIGSVLGQTYPKIELVVVDDGSTDGTDDAVRSLLNGCGSAKFIQKINGGASSARNAGFRQANPNAKYLFFLDADDQLKPETVEVMVSYLEAHPEVGLLGCQYDVIDFDVDHAVPGRRTRICWKGWFPRDLRDDEMDTPLEVFFCATGQGPFAMYRRSVFERTKGWSEDLWGHNDTDMFIQMALAAPVHYLPERLYIKKRVRGSLENRPKRDELFVQLMDKWNSYLPENPVELNALKKARAYSINYHCPLRNLKVSLEALSNCFRSPFEFAKLKWAFKLGFNGIVGLLRGVYSDLLSRVFGT